jgi:hypothetical protein
MYEEIEYVWVGDVLKRDFAQEKVRSVTMASFIPSVL